MNEIIGVWLIGVAIGLLIGIFVAWGMLNGQRRFYEEKLFELEYSQSREEVKNEN